MEGPAPSAAVALNREKRKRDILLQYEKQQAQWRTVVLKENVPAEESQAQASQDQASQAQASQDQASQDQASQAKFARNAEFGFFFQKEASQGGVIGVGVMNVKNVGATNVKNVGVVKNVDATKVWMEKGGGIKIIKEKGGKVEKRKVGFNIIKEVQRRPFKGLKERIGKQPLQLPLNVSQKPGAWHIEKKQDRQVIATHMKQTLVQGTCMFLECAEGFMIQELCRQGIPKNQMIAVSHAVEEIAGLQKKFGPTVQLRHMDIGQAIVLDIAHCGSVWIDLYGELVGSAAMYPPRYIQDVVRLFAASSKAEFFLVVTAKKSCRGGGGGREDIILEHQRRAGYKSPHILDMYYFFKFLLKKYAKEYGVQVSFVYNHVYSCMRTMAVYLNK